MKIFAETERLILRELLPTDDRGMFELDSDPDVHTFLGKTPIQTLQQAQDMIAYVRQQYIDNGIGRWAVVDKNTNEFMGWTGLKFVRNMVNNQTDYHDFGYRFIKRFWGKGYATETALPSLKYGFDELKLNEIYGMVDAEHKASRNIMVKSGLTLVNSFDFRGIPHVCYKITQQEFEAKTINKAL